MLPKNLLYGRTGSVPDNCISQFLVENNIGGIRTYNLLSLKLAYIYIRHLCAFSSYLCLKLFYLYILYPYPLVLYNISLIYLSLYNYYIPFKILL